MVSGSKKNKTYNGPRVKTSNEDLMVNVWL
jgi:hypothetical protein